MLSLPAKTPPFPSDCTQYVTEMIPHIVITFPFTHAQIAR